MDEMILKLQKLTLDVIERLDVIDYEELAQFVDQREHLIEEMKDAAQHEQHFLLYQDTIQSILAYDQLILAKIDGYMYEASSQMSRVSTSRKQMGAYNGYEALVPDSLFFDTKK